MKPAQSGVSQGESVGGGPAPPAFVLLQVTRMHQDALKLLLKGDESNANEPDIFKVMSGSVKSGVTTRVSQPSGAVRNTYAGS